MEGLASRRGGGRCRNRGSRGTDLVAAAGILEEAVVEAGAVREEVVDLAGLHVVGEAGDEEREDALPMRVRVRRVHVVGVHRRRAGREAVGEAHLGRAAAEAGSAWFRHERRAARVPPASVV